MNRVIRGCSWITVANVYRVAFRGNNGPSNSYGNGLGFRMTRRSVQ